MGSEKRCQIFLLASILMLGIGCMSICFTGIVTDVSSETGNNIPLYLVGGTFWAGFIGTYVCIAIAGMYRKRMMRKRRLRIRKPRPGILCFFQNREAMVADVIFFLSTVAFVMVLILQLDDSLIVLGVLILFLFSLHMHGILNGKTYSYLRTDRDKENDDKRTELRENIRKRRGKKDEN